ncbi:MAG: hypothetical protein K2N96_01510 [Muribaculaceae bacterium]|nr:hypothetical protein [Muribaculaceae bacterium]
MKTRNSAFSILLVSLVSLISIACNAKAGSPTKISIDQDFIGAIYSTSENGGVIDTISPCLLEETLHISELLYYPDDDGVTIPFNISDTAKYAEITESNLNKRIAITINGQIVSTPVVKMRLDNGACSVELDDTQVAKLFPNVNIEDFKSTNQ